jgi:predicted ATPase/DNA-binding winged helix-turn-helix (wHTH) protein
MKPAPRRPAGIAFGRFQLWPDRRDLLADGEQIKLGGRAFDVLMALIEVPGAVVSRDALKARVWPNRSVEDNNLAAQIVALRKALGPEHGLVRTVAGRGYQFTGETRSLPSAADEAPGVTRPPAKVIQAPTNLPQPVTELIGREKELADVLALLADDRFVNLTGPGGIGKTRLALAAARQLLPDFADGVWLAEFSAVADPALVAATVAAAAGLQLGAGEISPQVVSQALAHRRLLLILDTCEHVIEAAAAMAEALLQAGAAVHIIATSREPLRAEGEQIYQVPPLTLPAAAESENPWQSGAVRLFAARSRARGMHISEEPRGAAAIANICRQLDGIPLAIELAAARAATLGIEELAARLDDRFGLLTDGRRTALPRHQTLRAALDWSHDLLSEPERVILRRLAVFAGTFSTEAASAVAADPDRAPLDVVDGLSSLVAKSLVTAEVKGSIARHRLLDTTRAYALEKLKDSGEHERLLRRHAEYYRGLFERAEVERETRPTVEWLGDYVWCTDNLRAALGWAFSPRGDASIGIALTAAAVPLWTDLSLLDECRNRAEHALAAIRSGASGDLRVEMKLHAALAGSLIFTRGAVPEIGAAWATVLEIAERLDDEEYRLRSLSGLWAFHNDSGEYRDALLQAQKARRLAARRPDRNDRLVCDHMIAVSRYFLGDYPRARRTLERVVANYVPPDHGPYIIRFHADPRLRARVALARTLWPQGLQDQAMTIARDSLEDARAADHVNSWCFSMAMAVCPIELLNGDLVAAEQHAAVLLDHSARHALARWRACALSYRGALAVERGDFVNGLRLLNTGFEELSEDWSALWIITLLIAEAFGRAGQIVDGLAVVERAIERSERTAGRCLISELLRVKGELLMLHGVPGASAAAEGHFQQALDWAVRQGALSWELRAATSLARLWRDQGRSKRAHELLSQVYARFTEGFAMVDLQEAKRLLEELE